MKTYPLIAHKLFCQPWAILPQVLSSMCEQFTVHCSADEPVGPKKGLSECCHPQVEVAGGLALLRVYGTLGKHLSSLEMECGGYDVGLLEEQMEHIADDPEIQAVVIDFRSPGGSIVGIESAAQSILAVKQAGKKIYAYTSEMCASAAYWLACACDEIHAEPTAAVGSISTIVAGVDSSAQWAQQGLVRKVFATGKYKAMGMPGKPWTEDEEKHLWEKTLAVDADFKGFVRAQRGIADELMQGQWWHAKHAPPGLVDSVNFTSLEGFVEAVYTSL